MGFMTLLLVFGLTYGLAARRAATRKDWLPCLCNLLLMAGFGLGLTAQVLEDLGPSLALSSWQSLWADISLNGASGAAFVMSGLLWLGGRVRWRYRRRAPAADLGEPVTEEGTWPPPPSREAA